MFIPGAGGSLGGEGGFGAESNTSVTPNYRHVDINAPALLGEPGHCKADGYGADTCPEGLKPAGGGTLHITASSVTNQGTISAMWVWPILSMKILCVAVIKAKTLTLGNQIYFLQNKHQNWRLLSSTKCSFILQQFGEKLHWILHCMAAWFIVQ